MSWNEWQKLADEAGMRPCPFCGSPAERDGLRPVECSNWKCQTYGPCGDVTSDPTEWNRRPEVDLLQAVCWGGLGKSYDASVALDLVAWIKAGATGDLPPLPEYHAKMTEAGDAEGVAHD